MSSFSFHSKVSTIAVYIVDVCASAVGVCITGCLRFRCLYDLCRAPRSTARCQPSPYSFNKLHDDNNKDNGDDNHDDDADYDADDDALCKLIMI